MTNNIIRDDIQSIVDGDLDWARFANKTVLVTGANGFLPAYMVEVLLELNSTFPGQNTRIIALVRNKEKAEFRFESFLTRDDLEILVHDVCLPLQLDYPIDFIVHAASQASPKYYGSDPVGTLNANVLGTHNMLCLAKEKLCEGFLFFSSGEVYGEVSQDQIPTKETEYGFVDPTNVRSCYAESKRMGETMCVSWHHQFGVPAKVVRPFHTYGPGMSLDDGRVFADFVSAIVSDSDIVMHSDGSARRAFCYLADAVLGFFTVLLKGENGEAYNVGNDRGEMSILELAEMLIALSPEKKLKLIKQPERSDSNNYVQSKISRNSPNVSKARSLGWFPTTTPEIGFTRTIQSFK